MPSALLYVVAQLLLCACTVSGRQGAASITAPGPFRGPGPAPVPAPSPSNGTDGSGLVLTPPEAACLWAELFYPTQTMNCRARLRDATGPPVLPSACANILTLPVTLNITHYTECLTENGYIIPDMLAPTGG